MAQTTQIVPKFSFPYVETVVNDYTLVNNNAVAESVETDVKQIYAFVSSKGIDNTWVRKSSKESGVKTFGDSNFKKFGQPLMQALAVLDKDNSQVWMMRVMPENATYSNAIVSAYYKADTDVDVADAHNRKFRIKLTSKSVDGATVASQVNEAVDKFDGTPIKINGENAYVDAEGFRQEPIMTVRYAGRGTCGDFYSLRMSQAYAYEKEYGIKMYNFEVIDSEMGISKDANYVGTLVTSEKYSNKTVTLVNDVLDEADPGETPIVVESIEDAVARVYDAYIAFLKQLHIDVELEYEDKLDLYQIPEDQLNGTAPVTDDNRAHYDEIKLIEKLLDETDDSELVTKDEFDIIFGYKVGSTQSIPAIEFVKTLTDEIDTTAPDYDDKKYTLDNVVDFSSAKGLTLTGGSNGYFDEPRTVIEDGVARQLTYEDEVTQCYIDAFNGTTDSRILSPRRMSITAFWDANYPYEVKKVIADLAAARNDCRVMLDTGIIDTLSSNVLNSLLDQYSIFNTDMASVDLHSYIVKEYSTNKKIEVTISYLLAPLYVDHINNYGYHVPFVKEYAQLKGHVRDSLKPVVEEYQTDLKETLYNNRINFFECIKENVFQRATQNTTQKANTDLIEESNSTILYILKRNIENDIQGELYNFADESVRQNFVEVERAKYASWAGNIVESLNIRFATTKYEFEHSILHCYLEVVFRGLTKQAIVEIDLNKRTYTDPTLEL